MPSASLGITWNIALNLILVVIPILKISLVNSSLHWSGRDRKIALQSDICCMQVASHREMLPFLPASIYAAWVPRILHKDAVLSTEDTAVPKRNLSCTDLKLSPMLNFFFLLPGYYETVKCHLTCKKYYK